MDYISQSRDKELQAEIHRQRFWAQIKKDYSYKWTFPLHLSLSFHHFPQHDEIWICWRRLRKTGIFYCGMFLKQDMTDTVTYHKLVRLWVVWKMRLSLYRIIPPGAKFRRRIAAFCVQYGAHLISAWWFSQKMRQKKTSVYGDESEREVNADETKKKGIIVGKDILPCFWSRPLWASESQHTLIPQPYMGAPYTLRCKTWIIALTIL